MPNINDAFPSNYLKASDLQDRAAQVTIDRIEFEAVGQTKEMKPIVYFVGKEKGLVLNKTNANTISRLLGSMDTDDWHGCAIRIYPTETSFQGEMVPCIRVKAAPSNGNGARRAPAQAPRRQSRPEPEPESEPMDDGNEPLTDDDIPF